MVLFSLKRVVQVVLSCALGIYAMPAFAHVDASHLVIGFSAGLAHPFLGLDHLLAMLAIGLWAAQNKRVAPWMLPVVFPAMMLAGAAIAVAGMPLSGIEIAVAASVVLLGLFIAFAIKMPVRVSSVLVALFAMAHGYAHGMELPHEASALQYGAGFAAATAILHLSGLMMGLMARDKMAQGGMRIAGAGIAATGVFLLAGLI